MTSVRAIASTSVQHHFSVQHCSPAMQAHCQYAVTCWCRESAVAAPVHDALEINMFSGGEWAAELENGEA